jgi:hypothetical protein
MGRVLIIFQANSEAMEQLALAVAVGAVEAEGAIRLRRLAAADAPELAHKSYGRLQEDDLRWADVIVAGLEDEEPQLDDLGPLFEMLREVDLAGKRGWSFGPGGPDAGVSEAQTRVEAELQRARAVVIRGGVSAGSGDLIARMKDWGRMSAATPWEDAPARTGLERANADSLRE